MAKSAKEKSSKDEAASTAATEAAATPPTSLLRSCLKGKNGKKRPRTRSSHDDDKEHHHTTIRFPSKEEELCSVKKIAPVPMLVGADAKGDLWYNRRDIGAFRYLQEKHSLDIIQQRKISRESWLALTFLYQQCLETDTAADQEAKEQDQELESVALPEQHKKYLLKMFMTCPEVTGLESYIIGKKNDRYNRIEALFNTLGIQSKAQLQQQQQQQQQKEEAKEEPPPPPPTDDMNASLNLDDIFLSSPPSSPVKNKDTDKDNANTDSSYEQKAQKCVQISTPAQRFATECAILQVTALNMWEKEREEKAQREQQEQDKAKQIEQQMIEYAAKKNKPALRPAHSPRRLVAFQVSFLGQDQPETKLQFLPCREPEQDELDPSKLWYTKPELDGFQQDYDLSVMAMLQSKMISYAEVQLVANFYEACAVPIPESSESNNPTETALIAMFQQKQAALVKLFFLTGQNFAGLEYVVIGKHGVAQNERLSAMHEVIRTLGKNATQKGEKQPKIAGSDEATLLLQVACQRITFQAQQFSVFLAKAHATASILVHAMEQRQQQEAAKNGTSAEQATEQQQQQEKQQKEKEEQEQQKFRASLQTVKKDAASTQEDAVAKEEDTTDAAKTEEEPTKATEPQTDQTTKSEDESSSFHFDADGSIREDDDAEFNAAAAALHESFSMSHDENEEGDVHFEAAAEAVNMGYGDDGIDYGYGDDGTDYGYGDDGTDYGYGNENDVDYGYGDDSATGSGDSDGMGYGDDGRRNSKNESMEKNPTPSTNLPPRGKARRRASIVDALDIKQQAAQWRKASSRNLVIDESISAHDEPKDEMSSSSTSDKEANGDAVMTSTAGKDRFNSELHLALSSSFQLDDENDGAVQEWLQNSQSNWSVDLEEEVEEEDSSSDVKEKQHEHEKKNKKKTAKKTKKKAEAPKHHDGHDDISEISESSDKMEEVPMNSDGAGQQRKEGKNDEMDSSAHSQISTQSELSDVGQKAGHWLKRFEDLQNGSWRENDFDSVIEDARKKSGPSPDTSVPVIKEEAAHAPAPAPPPPALAPTTPSTKEKSKSKTKNKKKHKDAESDGKAKSKEPKEPGRKEQQDSEQPVTSSDDSPGDKPTTPSPGKEGKRRAKSKSNPVDNAVDAPVVKGSAQDIQPPEVDTPPASSKSKPSGRRRTRSAAVESSPGKVGRTKSADDLELMRKPTRKVGRSKSSDGLEDMQKASRRVSRSKSADGLEAMVKSRPRNKSRDESVEPSKRGGKRPKKRSSSVNPQRRSSMDSAMSSKRSVSVNRGSRRASLDLSSKSRSVSRSKRRPSADGTSTDRSVSTSRLSRRPSADGSSKRSASTSRGGSRRASLDGTSKHSTSRRPSFESVESVTSKTRSLSTSRHSQSSENPTDSPPAAVVEGKKKKSKKDGKESSKGKKDGKEGKTKKSSKSKTSKEKDAPAEQ